MAIPVLLIEQKNALLKAQLDLLTAKVALMESHKLFEERNAVLTKVINETIRQLNINPTEYTLDLDNLALVAR